MTNEEKKDSKLLMQFINERNGILENYETIYAIDISLHPQIDHIQFNVANNLYEMWDKEGNYFRFLALNYKETKNEYYLKKLKKN